MFFLSEVADRKISSVFAFATNYPVSANRFAHRERHPVNIKLRRQLALASDQGSVK